VERPGEWPSVPLVPVLIVLVLMAVTTGVTAVRCLLVAHEVGPGDEMSAYGAGRRVEVTWTSHGHEHGRVDVEDVGRAEVVALRRRGPDQLPHVTVRLGGRHLVLQGGPGPAAPEWFTAVDDDGYTHVRAEASVGPAYGTRPGPVDWTVWPAHGPVLRLRHRPAPHPARVTVLDATGTAWWVRDGRVAELPDDLDPAAAVFLVLLVDTLERLHG